jgi:peptidyl-prolyl cis-trans isomerase A (cyclophilin A)
MMRSSPLHSTSLLVPAVAFALALSVLTGCDKPQEIVSKDPSPGAGSAPANNAAPAATPPPAPTPTVAAAPKLIDLATATAGLTGTGGLVADIDVSPGGKLACKLYDDKAPQTVANFVGLARGLQSFKDPITKAWTTRPAYDGTIFHRIIKGFMIQGGDPAGTGSGEPGYVVPDEIWTGAKHDRAGLLCMANRGKNTNGMQFFITDDTAPHLDGNYTIFGECAPVKVVHDIAMTPVNGEKPMLAPKILSIKIRREKP